MINIKIEKSKKLKTDKQSGFISFKYDGELVKIMREQSTRFYHPDEKLWEIPVSRIPKLITEFGDRQVIIEGEIEQKKIEIPDNFEFKTKPYEHQIKGFEYGLKKDKFLIGDEPGLGKTKQAIDIAVAKKLSRNYQYCLIICGVNGLKYNWEREIEIHSNETSHMLGMKTNSKGKKVIGSSADKLASLYNLSNDYFLITNIETLRNKEIVNKLKELIDNKIIGMIIFDEIHKSKNPSSQQGKGLLKLLPETRIALTGTPLMNSPLDLYIVLKWLDAENHSFYQFKNYYCVMGGYGGYEVVGYRNLNKLQDNLDNLMIRRLKKDVLDLPPKIYNVEYVEMSKNQTQIYREVEEYIKSNVDKIKVSGNPLAQLTRLRQATAHTEILSTKIKESAKLDRLEEIIEELVLNNEKAIIFSNWTSMTNPTLERLKKFNPAIITGETVDRTSEQDKFMNDESCKCIIGTIGAMGTGLTLTAASTVIFLDSPWNRANKEQAEDRAHRIGTNSIINIITLVCKDTIDERIEDLIMKKGKMADALVDGLIEFNRNEVVDFLLS